MNGFMDSNNAKEMGLFCAHQNNSCTDAVITVYTYVVCEVRGDSGCQILPPLPPITEVCISFASAHIMQKSRDMGDRVWRILPRHPDPTHVCVAYRETATMHSYCTASTCSPCESHNRCLGEDSTCRKHCVAISV